MYKSRFFRSVIAAMAMMAASVAVLPAQAQTIKVASGDLKGGSVYATMFKEYAEACSKEVGVTFESVTTNGGVMNKDLLLGNKVHAAIVPLDLLVYVKSMNPGSVANIKTLFTLHPEELHFVARADIKKEGGVLGFGGKKVQYNTVNDLAGRVVGAVGGSKVSGEIAAQQLGVPFQIREYGSNADLQSALLSGQVDAILVVGGAKHKLVASFDRNYKLLTVPRDMVQRVTGTAGALYTASTVDYTNLGQAGISTISTRAVMVTRNMSDPKIIAVLSRMRSCFNNQVASIRDTLDTHEKWQLVDPAYQGSWQWYALPTK